MKRMKKLLAAILAAVMVAGLLPVGALAAEGEAEAVPELQEIGVRIGEDYVAAVPEEDGSALFSLLPLTEKRFTLDLTGYFQEELKAVTLETVIGGLTPEGAETGTSKYAVWAKQLYYDEEGNRVEDSDDFKVLSDSRTLDLSNTNSYCRLELIVGTADQLNPDNIRYIVQVFTSQGLDDMLNFAAKTVDGTTIEIYNRRNYYGSQNGRDYYQLTADPNTFPDNGESKLTFGFSDRWKTRNWTEIKVYQGYYETETDLPIDTSKNITDAVWSNGSNSPTGFQANYNSYQNKPEFTLVLKREGTALIIPFGVYMYAGNISINVGNLYEKRISGTVESFGSIGSYSGYEDESDIYYEIYRLATGKGLSGTYYLRLTAYDPTENGSYNNISKVKSAYLGKLSQEEISNKTEADDIKVNLFYDSSKRIQNNYTYEEGYPDGYKDGGYALVPSQYPDGIIFTVVDKNDNIHYVGVKFEASQEEPEPELPSAPTPLSRDTYFHMERATYEVGHMGSYISYYVMPYSDDSYYYDGYQTVFLLSQNIRDNNVYAVTADTIIPYFTLGNQVIATSNGLPYNPEYAPAATNQTSGVSEVTFRSGVPILYSAKAESGSDLKNYVVTFLTQRTDPTLFVNGTNYSAAYQDDPQNEGRKMPARVVHLTKEYGFHHDIFFANLGASDLTDLSVTLTGLDGTNEAEGVMLDDYWTIGATKSLAGFTTTEEQDSSGQQVSYGELPNVGKIRLQPKRDENGEIISGRVGGILTISAGTGEGKQEVRILLTGIAGDFRIVTTDAVDGVKYVSYSSVIQTNSAGASDAVTFRLTDGKLPDGVELKPNGELYGVPSKAGTYTFTLTATYTETVGGETYTQTDSREFTITITDNTDRNVWDYDGSLFDDGAYAIETAIPNENDTTNIFGSATQGDNRWSNPTQVLYSKGDYGTFVSRVFLDKQELTEGTDYTSESGSTRITLNTNTLKSKGNGTHTISAEFRVGGENGTLRRTAQNYTLTTLGTNSGGNQGSGSQGSGSGGSSGGSTSYTVSAPSSTSNGAVNVSPSSAKKGSSVTITVTPDDGYKLEKLTVTDSKGNPIKVTEQGDGKFTFVMPGSKVNVDAVFVKTTDTTVAGFSDVNPSAYYADAVTWAVEKGITVGTGDDTFSPNSPCTRAQIVTFLWRAAGSPIVDETSTFDDVPPDSFYYNAVQWAVAQGITVGTGGNTFSPNAACTRAQAVTFLYSYEQSPTVSGGNTFTDVAGGAYYTNAVQWAVDKGVTVGTSSTTFSPNATCTRSQIVTFLFRNMA